MEDYMLRKALLGGLIATSLLFAGCALYLGERDGRDGRGSGDYGYCDETGCYECDDYGCWPVGTPGGECSTNEDCPGGCYCNEDGVCDEAGFCRVDDDCDDGFVCDERASCVPEGEDQRDDEEVEICEDHADCPLGEYCDAETGTCELSDTCNSRECGAGWECDDRNTCVPQPCDDHDECVEGSYCEEDSGSCIPTERCDDEGQCSAEGYECDFSRDTCVPEGEYPGSCGGEITCDEEAPACDNGEAPLIKDGCFTGECLAVDQCDVAPTQCEYIPEEGMCIDAEHCRAVINGYDCTNTETGEECRDGDTDCECARYEFDRCENR
jgi:hypothetical protein